MREVFRFINSILAVVDKPFLASDGRSGFPPLFILGVPRSGTTVIYQAITQQFNVAYFVPIMNYVHGMPNIMMRLLRPFMGRPAAIYRSRYGGVEGVLAPAETGSFWFRWFPEDGELGHYVVPPQNSLEIDRYRTLKDNLVSLTNIMQRPMAFKCVYLDMVVGILAQLFPQARFVVVRRDLLLTSQSLYIRRCSQETPDAWWSVKPPQYQKIRHKPVWEQVVEQAFYTDRVLTRDLKLFAPERTMELDYEGFCESPRKVICELAEWLQPLGYRQYESMNVPESFPASNEITLSRDVITRMSSHLDHLAITEGVE